MHSIWFHSATLPTFPCLKQDLKTDVLIIGGGMAGILCAYMLKQAGVDYTLVEADRLCSGVSGKTTAKITAQHGLVYERLLRQFGSEKSRMYLEANQAALDAYRTLCKHIPCHFEEKDSFVYSLHHRKQLIEEVSALSTLGFYAEYTEQLPLPFPVAGAIKFPHQAQFQPLEFVGAIAKDLHIYEHTMVQELGKHTAVTKQGTTITASKIIVATHFPFLNKHGSYFLKLYQHRSYVLALKNAPPWMGCMWTKRKQDFLSEATRTPCSLVVGVIAPVNRAEIGQNCNNSHTPIIRIAVKSPVGQHRTV